jgi:hypothetical protein
MADSRGWQTALQDAESKQDVGIFAVHMPANDPKRT